MTTHQLECFVQVAENLNFARAAEALHITQPAVSRQIHSLENELGTALFHRTTRSVALTSAGQAFLQDALDILDRMKQASDKISRNADSYAPVIRIGCCDALDLEFLSHMLHICRQKLPQLRPNVQVIPHRHIAALFLEDKMDVILGFREVLPENIRAQFKELCFVDICCVLSSSHPFTVRQEISLEELRQEKLILCDSPVNPPSVTLLQKQMEHFYPSSSIVSCNNQQAAVSLVQAQYGFCILPDLDPCSLPGIACIPISDTPPLSFGLAYKSTSPNPLLKKFVALFYDDRKGGHLL